LQKIKVIAHEKRIVKKIFAAGWWFSIGGSVFLFVRVTTLKGGSELPKTAVFSLDFNHKSIIWGMIF